MVLALIVNLTNLESPEGLSTLFWPVGISDVVALITPIFCHSNYSKQEAQAEGISVQG